MTIADIKALPVSEIAVESVKPANKQNFELTDLGNAERLVAMFLGNIRYCHECRCWFVWSEKEGRWTRDTGEALQAMMKQLVQAWYADAFRADSPEVAKKLAKHAAETQKAARLLAAINLARNEPGIPIQMMDLDADPWLLNCSNGTVELRTGRLQPHRRRDLISKSTRVNYRPEAVSELWESVLSGACGNDQQLADYVQRVAGYAAVGVATERAFFFLHGPSGTAKSTLLDALQAALGGYACATSSDTWLARPNVGGNRDDLVDLQGVRLATSSEVRKGARWDEAVIKRVTGGDVISESRKFESRVAFRPMCTIVMAANDAPEAREDDEGLWARLRRIPFTAVIPREKQLLGLKETLREPQHAEAILAWVVRGALLWQEQGVGTCPAVERSTREYRNDSDRLREFLEERVVFHEGARILRRDLRFHYHSWCGDAGVRPLTDRELTKRLRALSLEERKIRGERLWEGVRMRTNQDE